jgi:RHS repeat-associated protein
MPLAEGPSDASTPLPPGGGAQDSLGESFEVDLATGSGSYTVPIALPPGPLQRKPPLSLVYGTGHGNGLVGLGWTLPLSAVARSTAAGLPGFDDTRDSFTYGGQRLVPVGGGRFRQEVEKDFVRVDRVGDGWELRLTDGTLMRHGTTPAERVTLPVAGADPVFQWLLESSVDAIGNRIEYEYAQDGGHARLVEIRYGPYVVRFDYEERPDPVVSHRLGVARVLGHRLRELRLVLLEDGGEVSVKAYRLGYEQAPHSGASRLAAVTLVAFDDGGEQPVPPLRFEYTDPKPGRATLRGLRSRRGTLPPPVAEAGLTMLDLDGVGLPGFLHVSPTGGHYWPNLGRLELGPARELRHFPTALADSPDRVRVASLSGHGLLDLVVTAGQAGGYYALQPGGEWETFRPFRRPPAVPLLDERTRFVDLDFDGRADLLYADERAFYAVLNRGRGDFERPRVIRRVRDRTLFPDVELADPRIHFADMTGDGTAALVEVHNRSVVYWPSVGLGRFAAAVRTQTPPELPVRYDLRRVFLVDVDGDGVADLVYVGESDVSCWFNRSGHGFSPPSVIGRTPPATRASVLLADVLGQGSQGLLWSGRDSLGRGGSHFFLDLAGPGKANLLSRIVTPSGAEVRVEYGTSVAEAHEDRGTDDAAYLPFPVQVVRRVELEDAHTGSVVTSTFSYHRGFYDRRRRRFLGFGRVERRDLGGDEAPDRLTVTHFHTRPPERATSEALQRHWVVARTPYRTEVFGADDAETIPFWVQTIEGEPVLVDAGLDETPVYFAARRRLLRTTTDRGVRTLEREVAYEYNSFGQVTLEQETQRYRDGADLPHEVLRSTETQYVGDGDAYLVGLPAQTVIRDAGGSLLSATRIFYDGLPLGGAERGVLERRESLALSDALVAEVYGPSPPDLGALGYVHAVDPALGPGWWITEVTQETDGIGNPTVRRDALGAELLFDFDAHGIYPARMENALGQVVTAEYDYRHGQLIRQVARDGGRTLWDFDAHGRLLSVTGSCDPTGQPSTVYEHAPFEAPPRLTIRRRASGGAFEVEHLYFDARGQRIQSRLELGGGDVAVSEAPIAFCRGFPTEERGRYFAVSTGYSVTDAPPRTPVARTKRDALDRPLELEDLGGAEAGRRYEAGVVHNYDAEDVEPASPHFDTPRSEFFNAAGQLVSAIERPTSTIEWCTQYKRAASGQLTGAADHLGGALFSRRYDILGRQIAQEHREAGDRIYVLDAAGNAVEERRGSRRIFRDFDVLGRITELRFDVPNAAPSERYTYDTGPGQRLVGRLALAEGDFGTVSYSYDGCGRLRQKTRTFADRPGETLTFEYTYDPQGRPTRATYPNGHVVDLFYDAAGRPVGVSGVVADVDYDPTGYVSRIELAYEYEQKPGRISSSRTGSPAGDSYQHFRYAYDRVGNPLEIEDVTTVAGHVRDGRRYVYDALYRLTNAGGRDAAGDYDHVYEYDDFGNLVSRPEVAPGLTLSFTAMTVTGSSGGETYPQDDQGNVTSLDGWTHDYDPTGRLTESIRGDGTRVTTLYDHTGARVETRVEPSGPAGVERTWYCDDAYVLNEDGSTETYVFFNRQRVAVLRSSGDDHVLHTDPLGHPTCFSRLSDGAFSGQLVHYPYGGVALAMSFGTQSRFGYGGHAQIPSTGLLHFGVRAYSPRLGRFVQPDPRVVTRPEGATRLPRGLHPYAYVIGNPVVLVDPYGADIFGDFVDWVGDAVEGAGRAIVGAAEAVAGAIADGAMAIAGAIADVAGAVWEGIKAVGSAIWEGIKWAAGVIWEGIKFLGQAIAFIGTWALTILDFAVTWLNPLTWIALGLDQIDHPIADVLSFVIKFARSPLTTTIGLAIGGIGLITGDVENVAFKNGMIVFEWDPGAGGFSGMVWGGVVHLWAGDANDPAFEHETYHSYQYIGWGDAFMPTYLVTGGWGLLSSALAGNPQWSCFGGVNDSYTYGQPLEMGGELIDASDNCR